MLLADLGAEVVRLERPSGSGTDHATHRILLRGRQSLALDLKNARGRDVALRLADSCDALIEGFRPGVMERLGLGPDVVLARNPKLVYGRMTGWGQEGPWADTAGHDINYIAAAGALEPLTGPDLTPVPPLNLLGDFGGGGMLLVCGMLAALLHARTTGEGQVVDAAIVDGTALLTAMLHSMRAEGGWDAPPGSNLFDGGAPYYGVYRAADGGWLALGAIEPEFYARLLHGLGLTEELAGIPQNDRAQWPRLRARIAARIAERPNCDWSSVFDGVDACVTAVVAPSDVLAQPHLAARATYIANPSDGLVQPAPAPRFSTTPLRLPPPAPQPGADWHTVLAMAGMDAAEIEALAAAGVLRR
jgi:alpha-methylacyl-CoA racemase